MMKIFLWIVGIYVVSIPVSQILSYSSGLLNQYLSLVFLDEQFWFDKGTTVKDIHEDIVNGENYDSFREVRYVPFGNLLFSVIWLVGELLLAVLLATFLIVRFLAKIMIGIFGITILGLHHAYGYFGKFSGPKKLKETISKPFREAKEKILNLRIA